MTITPVTPKAPPTKRGPVDFARGFLTGAVIGGSLAALVVAAVIEHVPLFVAGLTLPLGYGLLVLAAGAPRRAREASIVPRQAVAVIESRRATGGEASDVLVHFDVTVAPDDTPPYRVEFVDHVNLVDLPAYRPQRTIVVRYPPDQPWRVKLVKRPTPEWEGRAAAARIDPVPGPALTEAPDSSAVGWVGFLALLLGAAAVVFLFRVELFGTDPTERAPAPAVPPSTISVSAASGTVELGPGQSMLDPGELRRAVESLAPAAAPGGGEGRRALTVVVQDRRLTVVFVPTGSPAPGFDLDALPYPRVPALVQEARTGLGVRSPRDWQLTAEALTGRLVLRVGVTGADGGASLEADAAGRVVRRTPAH